MLDETAIAYAEVDEILNLLEDDYINKVPENVKRFKRSSIRANYRKITGSGGKRAKGQRCKTKI